MAQQGAIQIARTSLPLNDTFYISLRRIFGIGRSSGLAVAEACGISKEMRVRDLKESQILKVAQYIQENHVVGDQLRRQVRENILRLVGSGSYRGSRHVHGLPIKGRTHTNASTAKKLRHLDMYDTAK